jgi:putative effector of murein hydrolase
MADTTELQALLNSPLFVITLSLGSYLISNALYQHYNRLAVLNPVFAGAVPVVLCLLALDISFETYQAGNAFLLFCLNTTTVALAVPLYRCGNLMRQAAVPVLVTTLLGATIACASAILIAIALGATDSTIVSLSPKSVTTPIALALSKEMGGIATVAAGAVILTGITAISLGPPILRMLKVEDDRVWGFCLGLTGHGIGTARAFERSQVAGAFASLGLGLTGLSTALALPFIIHWLGY